MKENRLLGVNELAVGIWGSSSLLERTLNDPPVFNPESLESSGGVSVVAFLTFFVTALGFRFLVCSKRLPAYLLSNIFSLAVMSLYSPCFGSYRVMA